VRAIHPKDGGMEIHLLGLRYIQHWQMRIDFLCKNP
jgi:hypothetical protein